MMRSTALLVSLLLFQLLNSCEGNRKKESASSIKFTQHLYNAYIYENSAAKTYLESHPKMGIYITHPASEFRYKIISGDHENLFKAEDYSLGDFCFLRIRTKGGNSAVLNREVKDHYLLDVKAVEKKTNAEAQTKVKVHILDTNDLRPLFSPTSYSVSLAENTPLRTSVARVRATDADIGTNGEFYYSFKDWTGTFAIHPTNGVVTLTGRLGYSETKRYDLEILATDRGKKLYGSSGTSSLAKLTVHVEQGNENTPVITAVTLVPSDMDDDPTYAIVTVEDEDPGDDGEIASLNIVAGDPLHQFRAMRSSPGSKEYHIKAVDQIYWESQSTGYNLTLQARDKGNPPQFSSVKIIHVTSPQSKTLPCRFEKAVYEARLNEFAPLNTPVVMVTANPMYPHIKFAFRYHVDKFCINPDTGLITTNDSVKVQEASSYELEVLVVNRQASTKVIVYIIDMNDNAPEFKQSSYKSSVSENVPVGTSVLTVSATDVDTGENGYVTYSITNLNPQPFVIDYFSGDIRTSEELDYELMPRIYNLRVRASDWGSPYRREVEALVTIFLSNVNDNKPLFEKVNCIGTIPRDLNIGEQITTVSAIDADEMQLVRYQIVTGNELDLFDLNPNSGVLLLKRPLTDGSGVTGSFHCLQITATDGENFATPMYINITVATSSKQVNLHCTETGVAKFLAEKLLQANKIHNRGDTEDFYSDNHSMNHHAPQFDSSFPDAIKVKEDTPVGTKLLFVNATDFDNGFNGKLVHVISGGDSDSKFIVDMETGLLKVFSPLDREKKDHYTLNITVYDLGIPQKSAWRLLDVNILDANDNGPVFLQNVYSEVVSENKEVGSKIIQLEATDRDLGANGEVRYSILTDTDMFSIDSLTGIVKVIGLLDREKEPVYLLKVEARDQAKEDQQLFSVVILKVTLEDVNDNAPEFIPQNYHVKIREDLPEGTVAMWLEAYDPDVGQSSQVRYSLIDNGEGYFDVDKLSGALRLVHRLDFEKKQFYNLTARAKDKGRPISLSSTCHIHVEVVDVNENLYAPVFPFFAANGSVSEDVPIGTSVMTIAAYDNDRGRDGKVRYSIRDGSGLGVFTIDEEKGIIKTADLLDHETTSHYWLTVYATDLGVVPLFSFIEVYIEIRDTNDNAPQTSEPVYYPDVMENSPEGVSVVQIEATDPDSSSIDRLSYKITSGNPQGFFVINQETGLITTTSRKLDRERQAEHILEVTITDNDSNPKSTVARVIVKVLDENDNKPQFLQKFYKIKLPERIKPDREKFIKREPIFRVVAADKDEGPNAEISYSIEEGDEQGKFFIEPKTGVVSSKKFSAAGEYDILTIKVVDNGRPQKSSTARLHVEWIVKPDPPPVPWNFEELSYSFSVMESDPITHMVGVIAVEPVGTTLWFDITGGNYDSRFDVDKGSGTIIVARLLDAEQKSNYNLTVEATDGTSSISTQVYIKVIDTNDHRPEFSKPKYEVSIPEDTIPKTVILQVSARDEDEKNKLIYTLQSSTDPSSLKRFRLDPGTGVLLTAERLDHETKHQHVLTVMVRDQDVPVKRNYVRVIVNVEDTNDHAPWFTSSSYTGRVFESAAVDSAILQVTALDKDKGQNAEITYSIESGNAGNSFAIDPVLGTITVAKDLDRRTRRQYELVVKATDGGKTPMSAITAVRIFVTISDNAAPKFAIKENYAEINEGASIGTFVILITATSQSSIVYEIKDGNTDGAFNINPNSGVIITQKALDNEGQALYRLTVEATNMAGLSTNVTVLIQLQDENDNIPVFIQSEYVGIISESAHVNSVVLNDQNTPLVIQATDADEGSNALLVYQIAEPSAHKYFAIDSSTGAIRAVLKLDYEQKNIFHFTVQVHDSGRPQLFAEHAANVTIRVIDVNDCPPVFVQGLHDVSLLVPTYKGVKVTVVNATDADSASNADLIYSIIDGNIGEKFSIDTKTALISVQNTTHLRSRYELTVRASDGRFSCTTSVRINIKESKESHLKFTQSSYSAVVKENSTEVKTIAIITTVGNEMNEPLFYHILNPDRKFKISRTSGVLATTGLTFDREEQEAFDVVIEVSEEKNPSRVAHVVVKVTVEDINDNAPIFVNLPYYAVVQVDAEVGHVIRQVTAIDKDAGKNGEVYYHLKEHHEHFQIDPSGEISLKKTFEPTLSNMEYIIVVIVKDGGEVSLSAEVEVPITVINKAMPVFEKPFYSIEIPENIQLHTPVVHVQANSPEGPRVIYSITDGDPFNQFTINFNTGVINVISALDFETHPAYKLTIRATDSLTGSYSEVFVDIVVEDVNDNSPVFAERKYTATLSEASVVGTSVVQVNAADSDSGINKVLYYQLVEDESKSSEYFHIDSSSGLILTARMLDYEHIQQYDLLVRALDNGKPQLSSDIIVTLHVTDLNDNPPLFNEVLYRASLSEPITKGHFVTHVQASDADASDVEKLQYSIVSGNDYMNFAIDSKLGIITIANLPKQNLDASYNLGVSVSDGVFRSSAKVLVNILNANFHDPVFEQIDYEVELAENSEIGTLLIEVKATDKDSGTYGHVGYSIVSDFARDKFSVDQKGNIFTSEKLDRENPMEKVITISVMAKDGGGKVAFCNVNVILTDENDNVPQFRAAEYKVNIGSYAPKGSSVIRIVASDADEGSNADIIYAIEGASENVEENLQINSFTGIISTKESLVGLESNFYTFFVRARDGGIPQLDSVVPVYIRILQPEIPLPVFPELFYTFAVSEEISIGTEIDLIRAESDQPLIYSLVEGKTPESNMDKIFVIERDTGRLKTEKSLDHETTKWYQITVLTQYHFEEYEVISSVDVSIQVKDENDNKPIFDSNPYKAIVVENLPEGTTVIQVKASDLDSGVNGQVTYSLAQSQDLDYVLDVFTINGETGWITTLKELDHEKQKKYSIMVVASDHGEKVQLSASTVVDVTVIDVNDNPPRFTAEVYKGTVSEDDPPGGVIAILSTTDADTEEVNRQVTCYITGGDPLGQFAIEHIHNEWKVYVRKPLDREKKDHYLLNITATDGTLAAKAVVEVKVLDANDNSPICEKTLYTETIPEDVPSAKLILAIMAEDADIRSNGEITYTLHGTGAEKFRLDCVTGELKTLAPLDREQQAVYNLLVKATDGGGRFCQTDIVITLEDVNDNAPVFSSDPYTVSVFENTANKTLLTRVQATDPDAGLNRKVLYSLVDSADDHFSIDELSGIISLEKLLDRELQASYSLTVKATDQGALRKLYSVCTVLVSVLDINDNPPVFEHREYLATFPENIPLGTEVLQVFAASKDIEANGEITYSIISGNEHGKFSIDPRTGAIFVLSSLDFETSHEYYLTVEVTDGGTPSLNDVATVNINVTDINDNTPKFSHGVYMAVISEDAPLGQLVVTVIADDSDGPSNNQIHYSIINGNQGSPFIIDNIKGEIKVAQHLDREKISGYTLTVQASDNGTPSRFNTTTLNIDVADVNDNPPMFSQANYSVIIQENKPVGSSVLQLQVIDKDSSHNGPPFTFTIIRGNDGNEFQINPQGLLLSSSQLDHKIKDVYLLQVQVTDNGRPPLSSSTFIKLKIIEESIYPPAILPLEIHITTVGDEYAGGVIGKIHATDQDIYDTLRYSLASDMGNLFAVSSTDGKMIAHKLLDVGQYILNVTVTDGRFTTAADVSVHVKQVTENQVNHSIAIQFANITPEEFIGDYWRNFQRALRNILGIRRHDIHVVSLQPSEPPSNLDVLLTVNKASNSFHLSEVLFHKLNNSVMDMEEMMGVRILKVIRKLCAGLDCPIQFCDEKITIDSNAMSTHSTARLSFVTPRHHRTAVCLCKGNKCPIIHKLCESNVCPADTECAPDVKEERYVCLCKKGNRGQCSGGMSLSFNGNSYVKYRLMENENKEEMKLSLRLRTYHPYAFVMYAKGTDYSILEINNGRLQYKFDCGSGPGTVSVQSIQVNDGEWHSVSLEVDGNYARLVLDRVHTAAGTAPGTLRTLNLDNFLYFGGQIRQQHTEHRNTQVRNGFRGCLESVMLNGQELPLNSKPRAHAIMEESVEMSSGCSLMLAEGCSSSPCLNSGTCSSLPNGDYFCKCTSLFTGIHCEIGVSPCASNPCLYGGTCIPVNNNYICQCRGQYTGLRCEVGPYCKDSPCKNKGKCIDSLDGPVCECEAGYRGDRCLVDIDECHVSPCLNKGKCINTYGSFNCNCSHGFVGNLCADTVINKYVSTPWNIGLEEVIGIIVFVATIFILVLFFVFFRKKICKKKHHNDANEKRTGATTSFLQKNYFDSKMNKTIYSDIPPQVPVRPISYTPSIPSDSRNNLDRNSFEGSAIPEHPEFSTFNPDSMHGHRKTVAVCSVAPNLPPPPPSNSPSDCDSIQKPSWDYDYDAKVVDLESCSSKKALEDSACHPFNTRGSISEVQSLSSFQSESCDDNETFAGHDLKNPRAYHWDTSDWMPNVQLPGIQEYPQYELTEHQAPLYSDPNAIDTDYYPGGYDIESDFPPPPDDFPIHEELPPLPPEYNEFDTLQPPGDMPTAGSLNSTSQNRQHFNMNQYLPHHHYSANLSERQNAVPAGSSYRGTYPSYSLTYNDDFEAPSMDNISMSVYTSTTASCSDVSACCEMEESEVMMSDYESGDEGHFDDVTIPPLDFQQHTEV